MLECDTRAPCREVMLGVPSRPRATVGTQTAPLPFPPRMLRQAVDTLDLDQGMKGLTVSTQTPQVWVGKEWKGPEEGAAGEVSSREIRHSPQSRKQNYKQSVIEGSEASQLKSGKSNRKINSPAQSRAVTTVEGLSLIHI